VQFGRSASRFAVVPPVSDENQRRRSLQQNWRRLQCAGKQAGFPKLRHNGGASAIRQKRDGQASDAIIICFLPLFWSVKDRWSMLGWAPLAFCCGACVTTSADDE
jgi:hypothetical protein